MGLENANYIEDLVNKHPLGRDFRREGAAHFRNLKKALKNSLPVRLEMARTATGSRATVKNTGVELATLGSPIVIRSTSHYSGTNFTLDTLRPSFRINGGLGSLATQWWEDYFQFSSDTLRNGLYIFTTNVSSLVVPADGLGTSHRFVCYLANIPQDFSEDSPINAAEIPNRIQLFSRALIYGDSPDLATWVYPRFSFSVPLIFNGDYVLVNGKKFSLDLLDGYGLGIHFQIETLVKTSSGFVFDSTPAEVTEFIATHTLLENS